MTKDATSEQTAPRAFPKLMQLDEVCEVLRCSITTLRRLIKPDRETGVAQLASVIVGSTPMVAERDLWVYLRAQRRAGTNRVQKRERSAAVVIPAKPTNDLMGCGTCGHSELVHNNILGCFTNTDDGIACGCSKYVQRFPDLKNPADSDQ